MLKVIVCSKNPVKLKTAKKAFQLMFSKGEFIFEGINAASKVSDQPMSDIETLTGALNRIKSAKLIASADYYIAMEGGCENLHGNLYAMAWVAVESATQSGQAKSAMFQLPSQVVKLINQGMELGHADDIVFNRQNSKQANGAVGLLTDDVITRTGYYTEAATLALIPFKNPELY